MDWDDKCLGWMECLQIEKSLRREFQEIQLNYVCSFSEGWKELHPALLRSTPIGRLQQFQISVGPANFPKEFKINDGEKCHKKHMINQNASVNDEK